eukprot:GFUD01080678.1.p1 GENE.GFUD01080678.1~~GFUD01080678.1.p1  ORF type:complete len:365 (+),score=133.59 GFUD01080678.1:95-1189(+)
MSSSLLSGPVVMRGQLDWEPLQWGEENWVEAIKEDKIRVRTGKKNPDYHHPQWERLTEVIKVPTKHFFNESSRTSLIAADSWAYFDYKYLATELHPACLPAFCWDKFGYPGRDGSDSTLWVGTEGAHTPCHQDTYGENLVAQLVGSKTWTLFPPDQGTLLCPTRVPYEESSVYSSVNFVHLSHNSPTTLSKLSKTTPYMVTLQAGDVLYVPRHWWHQVYSNEYSISVNTWLEHPEDNRARLGEAIVRCQVAQMVKGVSKDIREHILNPNEDDLADTNIEELADLCNFVAAALKNRNGDEIIFKTKTKFVGDFKIIKSSKMNIPESKTDTNILENISSNYNHLDKLINTVTNPAVIEQAVDCYLA